MTRTEIIELANQLTERKGEKVLSLGNLYRFVVQDICKRQRFWWRRVLASFTLTVGTSTYDLTTILPAETIFDEITKFTLILSSNPLQTAELTPIFDPEAVIEMKQNVVLNNLAQPSRYTMNPGDYSKLLIDPPDLAYSAYIVGWAMPNPATDTTNDAVPLIPPYGHNTIVAGMTAKIFRFAYGTKNGKTIDAVQEYEQGILDLAMRKQFDPNYKQQFNLQEKAIQST